METLKIIALAVVQGLAEFLPVSSSGHLVLAGRVLGLEKPGVGLELALHVGTLVSVCIFYRRRLAELLADFFLGRRAGWLYALWVAVSMVPAAVVYVFAEEPLKAVYEAPRAVAALLVANGAILLLSAVADRRGGRGSLSWFRALAMGVGQAFAMLPGVSRSGTSITAGRFAGVAPEKAAEFSFLMSVPLIAGAALVEAVSSLKDGAPFPGVPAGSALLGAVVAGIVGYFALRTVVRTVNRGSFWLFGVYCLLAGSAALFLL